MFLIQLIRKNTEVRTGTSKTPPRSKEHPRFGSPVTAVLGQRPVPLPNTNRKRDWELLFTGAREGATVNGPFTGHTLPAQSRLRLWCTGAGCGKTGRGLREETPVNRTRLSARQSRLGPPAGAASPPAFRPALWQMKFIGPNSI